MVVHVNIELVAQDASKAAKRGDLIIVIDVLRASTSIITSLANGAKSVIPTTTLKEANQLHKEHPDYLLVGEREDCMPREFDLVNSPVSLTRERLQGKNIIITTTNGTKALIRSRGSRWITVGAFLNAQAVAENTVKISSKNGTDISLVLAGEKNHFSLEDFVCAGAITERFPKNTVELSDKTMAALLAFKGARHNLLGSIQKSKHAQTLTNIGFAKDVESSCQLDIYNIVPFYQDGKIQVSS
jgi:2-phosphosulfolactate phosphatase